MIDFRWLSDWQTLIGSLLGGVFALATALIVAESARRREERVAGALLISDLLNIYGAASNLENIAKQEKIREENYPAWVSQKLARIRPHLSALYDEHRARIMDVDARLSAHLSLIKTIYGSIDEILTRYEQRAERMQLGRYSYAVPVNVTDAAPDAKNMARSLALAGEHALCAQHLVSALVLSRIPTYHRIRRRFFPNEIEERSKHLIETGAIAAIRRTPA